MRLRTSLILAGILCLFIAGMALAEEKKTLNLVVLPCQEVKITFRKFAPLAKYLEGQLKRPIHLVVPKDYAQFEGMVKNGQVDFAYQSPHTYLRLADAFAEKNLLQGLTPELNATERGQVIVRRDSGISSLADLKGRKMMFGVPLSLPKKIAMAELFKQRGIDIDKDLASHAQGNTCESTALNVFTRKIDAGAVCDYSFAEMLAASKNGNDDLDASQLKVIDETMPLPTWVFTMRKDLDQRLVTAAAKALLELDLTNEKHEKILEGMELGGFIKIEAAAFDGIRQLVH